MPMPGSQNQQSFKELLAKCRRERSAAQISNRFPWQTRLAVLELLKHASAESESVRIISGSATEQFYGADVCDSLESCLKTGADVSLIIWDTVDRPCATLQSLQSRFSNFHVVCSGTREAGEVVSHFLVVGSAAYRLEAPHPYLGNEKFTDTSPETKAKICFHDPDGGGQLVSFFDKVWGLFDRPRQDAGSGAAQPAIA